MNNSQRLVVADSAVRDQYTSCRTREQALNAAILRADISENFEQYLDIFDAFYSDDVEVSIELQEQPIQEKARVRSLLANFLVPLHIVAEIGGLLVSVRKSSIPGDSAEETHSFWTLELVGVSGRTCTLSWRVARQWKGAYVASEHHYDHQQNGDPLTLADLSPNGLSPISPCRKPS